MKNNDPAVRALYIILVPVVALIIVLNTGFLQKHLTAVTVDGEKYNVVRFNYYYFDSYYSFLEENEGRLAELGYDPEQEPGKQSRDGSSTWKDYFEEQAAVSAAETAYFYTRALEAGYEFSADELAPIEEKLASNRADQTKFGLSESNYYIGYYGSGMDPERYTEELTRQVKARAYKTHLIDSYTPAPGEISQWMEANGVEEYEAVLLRIITLDALPDRETGLVGPEQVEALKSRLARLEARYDDGVPFDTLQQSFSSCAVGDSTGAATAVGGQLPEALLRWCADSAPSVGDTVSFISEDTAYFALCQGSGGSGAELEARAALGTAAVEEEAARVRQECTVERSVLGMALVGG